MQFNVAPRLAPEDDEPVPSHVDRTAAVMTLAGCAITLVAVILQWVEKFALGFSLSTAEQDDSRIVLAVLAAVSAGIAVTVLLWRPATRSVAILLIGLAAAQLAAASWFGVNIFDEIRGVDPHMILISAIGTGIYTAGLGSVITLVGAILAWTRWRVR